MSLKRKILNHLTLWKRKKLQNMPKCKSKKISKRSRGLTNTKKKSPNCKRAIYYPVPSTSGLNIITDKTEKALTSDSEMDTDVVCDEAEVCCVCKRFSPPNLNDRPYLKIALPSVQSRQCYAVIVNNTCTGK